MYVQAHKVGPGPRVPAKGAGQQVTVTFLSSYAPGYKRDYIEKHVAPDPEAAYLTNQQYESMQGYDGDNGAAPVAADGGGYELPPPEEDPNGYPNGYPGSPRARARAGGQRMGGRTDGRMDRRAARGRGDAGARASEAAEFVCGGHGGDGEQRQQQSDAEPDGGR